MGGFGSAGKATTDFSNGSGLISADGAKQVFYHNNTLYAVGQAAHFTGEWSFNAYGAIAAYKLEPLTGCYVTQLSNITATPTNIWPPNM